MIMLKKNYAISAVALAVAIPALISPAVAQATTGTYQARTGEIVIAQATKKKVVKKKKAVKIKRATPKNAKIELQAALKRLTPAQKREIGNARLGGLNKLSGNQVIAGGCFTKGVGCSGIPAFSKGVICCAIIKAGL